MRVTPIYRTINLPRRRPHISDSPDSQEDNNGPGNTPKKPNKNKDLK